MIRKFEKHDYLMVCDWLIKRGMDSPAFRDLPPTGLVFDNAACGFMIKTDNGYGIFDYFISNPDLPHDSRWLALEEIAEGLIDIAKKDEVRTLKCDTSHIKIYRLAIKHGFHKVGSYSSLIRGI